MAEWITIGNGTLAARINPLGAELSSLTDAAGREWMTDADPAFWTGRAPLLFPVVGAVNEGVIRLDGAAWPMPRHGFARHSTFAVSQASDEAVTFLFEANAETRRAFPFEFQLRVRFAVVDATLEVTVAILNPDRDRTLPASFGFHPAFAWPLPGGDAKEDHTITFAADEPGALKRIAGDGTIVAEARPSPLDGRVLHLRDPLFAEDALIWDPVESAAVIYGAARGRRLEIAFPGTPRLGIWTKPGARFVCVEPWHGIADPEGFAGDFRDKPGVFEIAAGAEWRCSMQVTVRD